MWNIKPSMLKHSQLRALPVIVAASVVLLVILQVVYIMAALDSLALIRDVAELDSASDRNGLRGRGAVKVPGVLTAASPSLVVTAATPIQRSIKDAAMKIGDLHLASTDHSWTNTCLEWPLLPPCRLNGNRILLDAWRNRKIDWHDLIPQQPVGNDHDVATKSRYKQLIADEMSVLSLLQGFTMRSSQCPHTINSITPDGIALEIQHLATTRDVSCYHAPQRLHGVLAKFQTCHVVRDTCSVHLSTRECVLDELCGWCPSRELCVSRLIKHQPEPDSGAKVPVCAEKLIVLMPPQFHRDFQGGSTVHARVLDVARGKLSVDSIVGVAKIREECSVFVSSSRHAFVSLHGNSKMPYHFYTENAPFLIQELQTHSLRLHIYVDETSTEELLHTMSAFTDSCLLYPSKVAPLAGQTKICYAVEPLDKSITQADLPLAVWDLETGELEGGEVVDVHSLQLESEVEAIRQGMRVGPARMAELALLMNVSAHDSEGKMISSENIARDLGASHSFTGFIIASLGLTHVYPRQPLVTLISRRNKRVILNEAELVARLRGMGLPVVVASLETMPLYEQILLFRQTTLLIGIHGSGLINSMYMHPGTALLQLMPYRVNSGASFFSTPAESHGISYFEWQNKHRENTVVHWHFLGEDWAGRKELILSKDSSCCGDVLYFSFWINQDTWVHEDEFVQSVSNALAKSQLNQ